MGNTFKLRFSGLCGFVPKYAIERPQNRMSVLLVDAMGSARDHGDHRHEHHEPVLLLPKAVEGHGPNVREPEGHFTMLGVPMNIFFLERRDLFIGRGKPPANELALRIDGTPVDGPCPSETNARSLRWVAPFESIVASSGKANPRYLSDVFNAGLGARVHLTRGTIANAQFARDQWGNLVKAQFIARSGNVSSYKSAISEVVEYEVDLGVKEELDLTTSRMSGPEETIRVVFGQKAEVTGYILNMPLADILRRRRPLHRRDFHFEHLFDLCDSPPKAADRPVPDKPGKCPQNIGDPIPDPMEWEFAKRSRTEAREEIRSVSSPKCPPALLEPEGS